jgi:hypothetical protein
MGGGAGVAVGNAVGIGDVVIAGAVVGAVI